MTRPASQAKAAPAAAAAGAEAAVQDPSSASVGDLVGSITKDISTLMRQELDLAKAEVKQEAIKSGKAAGMYGAAGFAGYMVLLFASIALWWGLANLKTAPFNMADIAAMKASLSKAGTPPIQAVNLHFALGKALEDDGDYAASFHHYEMGNQLRRLALPYDPDEITREVERSIALFSRAFFEERADFGQVASDPIFIVGMPRAGSTLVEQILASHSQVEGTSDLPDISLIVHRLLSETWRDGDAVYPELLARMTKAWFLYLGQNYLAGAEVHRKSERPCFIDKSPDNWAHVGLIHLLLPGARIIDVRRDAAACCFANYKQLFALGHEFSYDLRSIAHYYRDYVALMDHMDAELPGRIIRIQYEDLVADPERAIRALLDQLGLPFEDSCLRFHENTRPVRAPSAEQVRRPINRDALDQWRNYEPWLDELKQALGPLAPK